MFSFLPSLVPSCVLLFQPCGPKLTRHLNPQPFRDVLYVDQTTKLVTAIEVYELKDGRYEYNGVWKCYKHDQPFEAGIFDLEDEVPADVKRLTTIY
jgi:hypothetical protein